MKTKCLVIIILMLIDLKVYSQNDSLQILQTDSIPNLNTVPVIKEKQQIPRSLENNSPVYTLKAAVDIPIIAVGTAWSAFAFTKIYVKTPPTVAQIEGLKKSDINAFDRWAVNPYSKRLDDLSYYPFYASIPLPLIYFLVEKKTRSDFFKLAFLYWEAMSITGLLGTSATYHIDRYRPYAYTSETSMDKRTGSIAKNSFYAGHVQVVATPTFFLAKVYADYHPDSKYKWVFYGVASLATGATAYMRIKAGEHFPTDVILGTATGALAGILVPQYHKTRSTKVRSMSIMPYSTGEINGLVFIYQINNNSKTNKLTTVKIM